MKTVVNAFLFNMSLGECYAYPLVHIAMKLGPIQDVTCVIHHVLHLWQTWSIFDKLK